MNELISNSLKHAFPQKTDGEITVMVRSWGEGKVEMTVSDNGIGIPDEIDYRNTESMGMQLIVTLVSQLKGTINLNSGEGTIFRITFSI